MTNSIKELFHVFVFFKMADKERVTWASNITEEEVIKQFAIPFFSGKDLWGFGEKIKYSTISQFHIFQGKASFDVDKTILPNGKSIRQDYYNAMKYLSVGFLGFQDVTSNFAASFDNQQYEKPLIVKTNNKIFIVHGRDDREALALQKYLKESFNLNSIIFDDFKRKTTGKTVIEVLEEIKDSIGYAFIIAAPEDLGQFREEINEWSKDCLMCNSSVEAQKVNQFIKGVLNTRARQNVVFEYGLFMGALGRDRVCCLLQTGTKEKPSDISGVLYEEFKQSINEKFADIAEKLKNPKIGLIK